MSLADLGDYIYNSMTGHINELLDRKPKKKRPILSLSSAGKCQRISMYKILDAKGISWSWRQRITLEDGDWGHDQLRKYMRKSFRTRSHFKLVGEEESVYLNVSGTKIEGHIDGAIARLCDCEEHKKWPRTTLLEIKTASPASYNYMARGDISKDYKAQATAYMGAMNIKDCLFMIKNKGTGEFSFIPYERDDELLQEIFSRYKRILSFKKGMSTNLKGEYGPDDKGKLPFQCNYCPYVVKCWEDYKPRKVRPGVNVYQLSESTFNADDFKEV